MIGLLTSPLPRKRSECQPCIARAAASLRVLPDPEAWISPSKENVGKRTTMKKKGCLKLLVEKEERKQHLKWAKALKYIIRVKLQKTKKVRQGSRWLHPLRNQVCPAAGKVIPEWIRWPSSRWVLEWITVLGETPIDRFSNALKWYLGVWVK